MKKILIVHNFYKDFGGEDSNINQEINALKKNFEVIFYSLNNADKLNIYDYFSFIFRRNFKQDKNFKKLLNEFKPDIVYVHNTWFKISLGIFAILIKKNIKTIVKIHSFRYRCSNSLLISKHLSGKLVCSACNIKHKKFQLFNKYYSDSYTKSFFLILYSKKFLKIIQHPIIIIAALNEFHKHALIKLGFDSEKIRIIHNPIYIDEKLMNSSSVVKTNSIVYAGRISFEKGINELIESFINSNLSNYILYIIGTGPYFETAQQKYTYTNVKFMNFLSHSDTLKIIQSAKAVVTCTKLLEGQPMLLCEASALKTISIFPNFGGMVEFFPDDYPFKFAQGDYEDLVKKIKLIENNDLLNNSAKSVFNFISKKIDRENYLNNFFEILQNKIH